MNGLSAVNRYISREYDMRSFKDFLQSMNLFFKERISKRKKHLMMGKKYNTLGHSQLKACSGVVPIFFCGILYVTTTE